MVHPVQSVIESLYAAGRCPRLHVDATHASVTVPDFIRQQWRERLIIDLDASYPLDLVFGESGLAADLSFGGHVTRCSFPWESIYIVTDRSTGRGIVLDRHVPESVRRQAAGQQPAPSFEAAKAEPPAEPRPELRRVEAEPALETASPEDAPPAAAPSPNDDQAKKRRAAFRVIDGGG